MNANIYFHNLLSRADHGREEWRMEGGERLFKKKHSYVVITFEIDDNTIKNENKK